MSMNKYTAASVQPPAVAAVGLYSTRRVGLRIGYGGDQENNPIRIWRFQGGDLTQGMKERYQALLGIQAWGPGGELP